jgi:uncharacterized membrane protein (DUF2068 family)
MLPLIGAFKLVKGVLILVVALGVLRLLHGDAAGTLERWAIQLHIDPEGRHVDRALHTVLSLGDRRLEALSAGMFAYAALFVVEGVGLMLRERWAEYLTVIVTASFVPLELYEIARHPTAIRVAALLVNLAIVAYLVAKLREPRARAGRQGHG